MTRQEGWKAIWNWAEEGWRQEATKTMVGATRSHFVKTNIPRTISLTANKFEKSSFFLLRGDQILQLIYGPLFVLVSPEQIVVPWAFFMTFLKQIFRFDC